MKKRIIFCLGSNLGNREENLNRAIEDLIFMLELSKIAGGTKDKINTFKLK